MYQRFFFVNATAFHSPDLNYQHQKNKKSEKKKLPSFPPKTNCQAHSPHGVKYKVQEQSSDKAILCDFAIINQREDIKINLFIQCLMVGLLGDWAHFSWQHFHGNIFASRALSANQKGHQQPKYLKRVSGK